MTDSADLEQASTHSVHYPDEEKDVHCIQQQSVTKLTRSELEDLFYQLHDENIHIKKKFNTLDNKYKIMTTRVMRLSRDQKCVDAANREDEQKQLRQLRQNEAALRAKLTVLRGQLASHTRLHAAALSKLHRPTSHRCSRVCRSGKCSSCGGDDGVDIVLYPSRAGSQTRDQDQSRNRSSSQSGGRPSSQKSLNDNEQTNTALREQIVTLQEKIVMLEKDMKFGSDHSHQRLQELEAEIATRLSQETAENVELIRARRINKQHEAVITTLQLENQELQHQLEASKAALTLAARDQDEMCSALEKERQRNIDLQQENVKLTHMCASLREVQEQLNDLKRENAVLKEHSNRLLQLTNDNENGKGDQMKADRALTTSLHLQDTPIAKEEHAFASQQLSCLHQEQTLLQQQLSGARTEVVELQKNLVETNEERYRLHQELSKVRKECIDLHTELAKSTEESKELSKKLVEYQNECSHLEEEISKSKAQLQLRNGHLTQAQQEINHNPKDPSILKEKTVEVPRTRTNFPLYPIPLSRPFCLMPQTSAKTALLGGRPSQTQSQPVTPRPRVGDACLTLLEQTAIRPFGASFPGVLGSHGSLQERFLELCLPTNSPTASSTPLPPMEEIDSKVNAGVVSGSETPQHRTSECLLDHSPKQAADYRSPRSIGLADTQWELDKCRELLRVQCNLNSIYKKEVASLNQIVKTLTTGGGSDITQPVSPVNS